jgi:phosphoribosylglycinamide formyltransferase-1
MKLPVNLMVKLCYFCPMKKIAIFASGSGTNAQRIIEYFSLFPDIKVDLVLSNNAGALVLERANNLNVDSMVFSRDEFYNSLKILEALQKRNIIFLVLAGFLWMVPGYLLESYPDCIINIHPALLPKYGGKGMYGTRVHEAVLASGDNESGITIHYVNEKYDEGQIIFQAKCPVIPGDSPETLAARVHQLEYRHYPEVIEKLLQGVS